MTIDLNPAFISDNSVTPVKLVQPFTRGTLASLSSTAVDFTGIPSWARQIMIAIAGASTSATSNFVARIGSGSIQSTGYTSGAVTVRANATNSLNAVLTTGFVLASDMNDATLVWNGAITLSNVSANIWLLNSKITDLTGVRNHLADGLVTLPGVLDRVRFTMENGTDTFDAGSINVFWE